jgi:hypothetical protein
MLVEIVNGGRGTSLRSRTDRTPTDVLVYEFQMLLPRHVRRPLDRRMRHVSVLYRPSENRCEDYRPHRGEVYATDYEGYVNFYEDCKRPTMVLVRRSAYNMSSSFGSGERVSHEMRITTRTSSWTCGRLRAAHNALNSTDAPNLDGNNLLINSENLTRLVDGNDAARWRLQVIIYSHICAKVRPGKL